METLKLKRFAQYARRSLLEQVSAKLKLVLAENSAARRESTEAIKKLEEAIKGHGKEQVIERVAYIWFNRFCAQARSIEPAVVWGRLYHLHAGFPALEVPEGLILARATADPLADARRQQEIDIPRFGRPTGDWDLIHGELVTFTDPQRDLPPIDRLEGFRPCGHSMYQRVMVAAECRNASIAVWIYRMARVTNGERIDQEWRG